MEKIRVTEQEPELGQYSDIKHGTTLMKDSQQSRQRSLLGRQSSENSSGSSKEAPMREDLQSLLTGHIELNSLINRPSGPPMPTLKAKLLDTSTMSSPRSLVQSTVHSGVGSTRSTTTQLSARTKSWEYFTRSGTNPTQDESYYRHGTLCSSIIWLSLPVIHYHSFVSSTVS